MIDFRTSFRSHAFFEALARRSGSRFSAEQALARLGSAYALPPVALDAQVSAWVAELASHGVEHAGALAAAPEELAQVAEAAEVAHGVLLPLAPVDPTSPGSLASVERWLGTADFRGIALSPARDGYRIGEGRVADVLDSLGGSKALCIVEFGLQDRALDRAFGVRRPFDPIAANPLELLAVAERHRSISFVVPSFGAGFFRELLLLASQADNVYTDTGSPDTWRAAQSERLGLVDVFERALDVLGPQRVLFATGCGAPERGWRHEILTYQREAVGACGLTAAERDLVFDGNARRLLCLPAAVRHPQPSTAA